MAKRKIKQYSLVKFICPMGYKRSYFEQGLIPYPEVYVFLGEIPNMVGHCIVLNHKSGRILSGFHIEDFVELSEEEI